MEFVNHFHHGICYSTAFFATHNCHKLGTNNLLLPYSNVRVGTGPHGSCAVVKDMDGRITLTNLTSSLKTVNHSSHYMTEESMSEFYTDNARSASGFYPIKSSLSTNSSAADSETESTTVSVVGYATLLLRWFHLMSVRTLR